MRAAWQSGSNFNARGPRARGRGAWLGGDWFWGDWFWGDWRRVGALWVGLVCGLWPGCRCASDKPSVVDVPPAASSNCERGGMQLTLAPSVVSGPGGSPLPSSDAGPELGIDLPFSIEPGMALGLGGRFFATALRHDPQGSMALLARLSLGAPASPAAGSGVPPAVAGVARFSRVAQAKPPSRAS